MTALDAVKQLIHSATIEDAINVIGVGVLAVWLLRTSLGRTSLAHSRPRRNSLSPITALVPFVVWILGSYALSLTVMAIAGVLKGEVDAIAANIVYCVVGVLTAALILVLARMHFARGLKGFGLNPRTVPRDAGAALVKLLAVWPLVYTAVVITTVIGRMMEGQDFDIPRHEALKVVSEYPDFWMKFLTVATAVVVAPCMEEMLWRGLFQTTIRTYVGRPWLAISVTALLFAMIHAQSTHWPALFVLAMGLGYAYERSGSLFQSIFMHALFNGSVVLATLVESMRGGS